MKFVLMSDVHLLVSTPIGRVDNIRETQKAKLRYIFDFALKNDCIVLIAGDFFDSPRSWYLLPEIADLLSKYSSKSYDNYRENRINIVYGQHDAYYYSEEAKVATNLGILGKVGLVDILNKDPLRFEGVRNVDVYGCHIGQEVPEPLYNLPLNVLVIHAPISLKSAMPAGGSYIDAVKFLEDNSKYHVVLCGDIHRPFFYKHHDGRVILNTGPMIRKTADEFSFKQKPHFYVMNVGQFGKQLGIEFEKYELPCKLAHEVLSREHMKDNSQLNDTLTDFYTALQNAGVDKIDALQFLEVLWEVLRSSDFSNIKPIVDDIIKEVDSGRRKDKI